MLLNLFFHKLLAYFCRNRSSPIFRDWGYLRLMHIGQWGSLSLYLFSFNCLINLLLSLKFDGRDLEVLLYKLRWRVPHFFFTLSWLVDTIVIRCFVNSNLFLDVQWSWTIDQLFTRIPLIDDLNPRSTGGLHLLQTFLSYQDVGLDGVTHQIILMFCCGFWRLLWVLTHLSFNCFNSKLLVHFWSETFVCYNSLSMDVLRFNFHVVTISRAATHQMGCLSCTYSHRFSRRDRYLVDFQITLQILISNNCIHLIDHQLVKNINSFVKSRTNGAVRLSILLRTMLFRKSIYCWHWRSNYCRFLLWWCGNQMGQIFWIVSM